MIVLIQAKQNRGNFPFAENAINPKGNMGGPISSIYDCVPNIPNNAPTAWANGIIICNMFIGGWGKKYTDTLVGNQILGNHREKGFFRSIVVYG